MEKEQFIRKIIQMLKGKSSIRLTYKTNENLQEVSMEWVKTTDVANKILFQKVKPSYPRAL